MNTPDDASDTAIERLIGDDAVVGDTLVTEVAAAISDYERAQTASITKQLADIERYFALCHIEPLGETEREFVRMCLSCAWSDGYFMRGML